MRGPVRTYAGRGQSDGGLVSRYRRDWDEDGKANSRDSAEGTPGSAASTRADANWERCAASVNMSCNPLYLARARGVTPNFSGAFRIRPRRHQSNIPFPRELFLEDERSPSAVEGASSSQSTALEIKPQSKLNQPWIIYRIVDHSETGGGIDVLLSGVGETVQEELGVIKQIKELSPELQTDAFAEGNS